LYAKIACAPNFNCLSKVLQAGIASNSSAGSGLLLHEAVPYAHFKQKEPSDFRIKFLAPFHPFNNSTLDYVQIPNMPDEDTKEFQAFAEGILQNRQKARLEELVSVENRARKQERERRWRLQHPDAPIWFGEPDTLTPEDIKSREWYALIL